MALTPYELRGLRDALPASSPWRSVLDRELHSPQPLLLAPSEHADLVWWVGPLDAPTLLDVPLRLLPAMRTLHRLLRCPRAWCFEPRRPSRSLRDSIRRAREHLRPACPELAAELVETVEVSNALRAAIYRPGALTIVGLAEGTRDSPRAP